MGDEVRAGSGLCAKGWSVSHSPRNGGANRDEMEIARQIRSASPIASPNRLIVAHADKALGRDGRMLRALDKMGPATMMVEGRPFRIELE